MWTGIVITTTNTRHTHIRTDTYCAHKEVKCFLFFSSLQCWYCCQSCLLNSITILLTSHFSYIVFLHCFSYIVDIPFLLQKLITAPILPYISRNHRRNLKNLDWFRTLKTFTHLATLFVQIIDVLNLIWICLFLSKCSSSVVLYCVNCVKKPWMIESMQLCQHNMRKNIITNINERYWWML